MKTKSFLSILAFVVVVLAGGAFLLKSSSTVTTTPQQAAVVATTQDTNTQTLGQLAQAAPTDVVTKASRYKDGTYSATGDYTVPEGRTEAIAVTVTLKNGLIIDSTVTSLAQNHDSRRFNSQFISGYKAYVTGKSIDQAKLSNVSGSSLTGAGWNTALESIKAQAAV